MIKKYKKKVMVVEAIQNTVGNTHELISWLLDNDVSFSLVNGVLKIVTPEGEMTAEYGSWIIKGIEGEFYPCKESVFNESYLEEGQAEKEKDMEGWIEEWWQFCSKNGFNAYRELFLALYKDRLDHGRECFTLGFDRGTQEKGIGRAEYLKDIEIAQLEAKVDLCRVIFERDGNENLVRANVSVEWLNKIFKKWEKRLNQLKGENESN